MRSFWLRGFAAVALAAGSFPLHGASDPLLLDDFSSGGAQALIGTRWEAFTDRVMGGRSDMAAGVAPMDGEYVLRMTGAVSLENNGGFIQVRLPLPDSRRTEAASFTGVFLEVRGAPGSYYIHLRDNRTRAPWAYYRQRIDVRDDWQTVRLPFDAFESAGMLRSLTPNVDRLQSVAIVAAGEAFDADIMVRSIGLYR